MSLIAESNTFALGAVLFGLAWLGFWIDGLPLGRKTSGVIWVLGVAMLLSNTHVIPLQSPAYGFAFSTLVPLAIPLLLLKADLRTIFRESGPVLATFAIAAMATVVGALVGFVLLDLGDIGPRVAGVYTGGWIGGAVNFIAVSNAVQMTPEELTAALSASSVVSIIALMILIALPAIRLLTRWIPLRAEDELTEEEKSAMADNSLPPFRLTHVSGAITISFILGAIGQAIGGLLGQPQYDILFITILTIVLANVFPGAMRALRGDFELGLLLMYIFFAAIGASTDATAFVGSAPILFVYGMIIILVHLVLVLIAARVLKVDLAEAVVASGAALVGPAATAAIATSRGWRKLVTPAIMCGILGYAIATFIGVALSKFLA